jgi:Chitin binding Peritrophin-A domain
VENLSVSIHRKLRRLFEGSRNFSAVMIFISVVISLLLIPRSALSGFALSQVSIRTRNRDRISKRTTTTTRAPAHIEDDGTSDQCPEPDGFFADADQCDKYYACSDGKIEGW